MVCADVMMTIRLIQDLLASQSDEFQMWSIIVVQVGILFSKYGKTP